MFEPSPEQKARILEVSRHLIGAIPNLWRFDRHVDRWHYEPYYTKENRAAAPLRGYLEATCATLETAFPRPFLEKAVPETLFFPAIRRVLVEEVPVEAERNIVGDIVGIVTETWTREHPSAYAVDLLIARTRQIFAHPCDELEAKRDLSPSGSGYFPPALDKCLEYLADWGCQPEALPAVRALVSGEMNYPNVREVDHQGNVRQDRSAYDISTFTTPAYFALGRCLFERGELRYEDFRSGLLGHPGFASYLSLDPVKRDNGHYVPFWRTIQQFHRRLAGEAAEEFDERGVALLCKSDRLSGSWFLLKACAHAERLGVGKIRWVEYFPEGVGGALLRLADIVQLEPGDEEGLVAALGGFKPKTLEAVMPVAGAAREQVLAALGWEALVPLLREVRAVAEQGWGEFGSDRDLRNNPDPRCGVVDRARLAGLLAAGDEKSVRRFLALLSGAGLPWKNTLLLVEAVAGWNRADVEKKLAKRNQPAFKACGLLPLVRGTEEALERYTLIRRFEKEADQFGPQRQANERAAAKAALANLAQTAGFPSATRLEWAMEARLSRERADEAPLSLEGYEVALDLAGGAPTLVVRKAGRELKSVPPAVRKLAGYKALKERATALEEQGRRFRNTFEEMMAVGEGVDGADLRELHGMPMTRAILSRLLLRAADGFFGFLDADGNALEGLEGAVHPLVGRFLVAHPWHLLQSGLLSAWQREVVRRRVRQPFKQVFRELYVPTPAEEETATYSNRFAGHTVDPRIVTRLLQARRWLIENERFPRKEYPDHGLRTVLSFSDMGHFLAETETVTTDRVFFVPADGGDQLARALPLASIPPTVFSETMRDVDLFCSVARKSEDRAWSEQTFERMRELVDSLVEAGGLQGVRTEGHFAHVVGRLASYRVHLGSGSVHLDPGNYLCIVPAEQAEEEHKEGLFLPFLDDGERKTREVISKIVLLANDDRIRDPEIRAQIRRGGAW